MKEWFNRFRNKNRKTVVEYQTNISDFPLTGTKSINETLEILGDYRRAKLDDNPYAVIEHTLLLISKRLVELETDHRNLDKKYNTFIYGE